MNNSKLFAVTSLGLLSPVPAATPANSAVSSRPLSALSLTSDSSPRKKLGPPPPPHGGPGSIGPCGRRLGDLRRGCIVGPVISVVGAALFVSSSRCLSATLHFSARFSAPFFSVYFVGVWSVVVFPCRLLFKCIRSRGRLPIRETIRESFLGHDDQGFSTAATKMTVKCAGFCVLASCTQYLYLFSLKYLNLVDCSSLASVHCSFSYLLSWIILRKKFVPVRIVALILAMTGVVLLLHSDGIFGTRGMLGTVFNVASIFGSSLHKVLFTHVFGDITTDQLAFCLTFTGVIHLLTMGVPVAVLRLASIESLHLDSIPWMQLVAASVFSNGFNCLTTFGANVTFPVFLHACLLLAMPLSIAAAVLLGGGEEERQEEEEEHGMKMAAYLLFVVAFLLNLLPENFRRDVIVVGSCVTYFRRRRRIGALSSSASSSASSVDGDAGGDHVTKAKTALRIAPTV